MARLGNRGGVKVLERFPLTDNGWHQAWQALVRLDAAAAETVRAKLAERESRIRAQIRAKAKWQQLEAASLNYLQGVIFLSEYSSKETLFAGRLYDVRFLEDRLAVFPCRLADVLVEVPYAEIEVIGIGGPGLVKSGGGFIGGGFGPMGAAEGMAIAAVLNAVTTKVQIKTVIRVQAASCELFLLHTRTKPDDLRIELSRALGAVRDARSARTANTERLESGEPISLVTELSKLAALLEKGLLTGKNLTS